MQRDPKEKKCELYQKQPNALHRVWKVISRSRLTLQTLQTTVTLPCFLDMPFEAVPFFLSLLRTLSRYILADPRELVGRMRDFAEEGLPYDAL